MKKTLLSALVICTILLTGCSGEKKLVCQKSDKSNGVISKSKTTVSAKGETITKIFMENETDVSSNSDADVERGYAAMKSAYNAIDEEGIKVNLTKDKKIITISMDMDLTKTTAEQNKKYAGSFISSDGVKTKLDDIKKYFEDNEYTCK